MAAQALRVWMHISIDAAATLWLPQSLAATCTVETRALTCICRLAISLPFRRHERCLNGVPSNVHLAIAHVKDRVAAKAGKTLETRKTARMGPDRPLSRSGQPADQVRPRTGRSRLPSLRAAVQGTAGDACGRRGRRTRAGRSGQAIRGDR